MINDGNNKYIIFIDYGQIDIITNPFVVTKIKCLTKQITQFMKKRLKLNLISE